MENTSYSNNGAPIWSESITQVPQFSEPTKTMDQQIYFPYTINE